MNTRKVDSRTNWKRVQEDVRMDKPVVYDPDVDPYDPNDPDAVAADSLAR